MLAAWLVILLPLVCLHPWQCFILILALTLIPSHLHTLTPILSLPHPSQVVGFINVDLQKLTKYEPPKELKDFLDAGET